MSISLMNILGNNVNLTVGNEKDGSGRVVLSAQGDAAFATVMAAADMQDVSAERLQQFFGDAGVDMQSVMQQHPAASPMQSLLQWVQAQDAGQNLPGEMLEALQQVLPDAAMGSAEGLAGALAALPHRELTAEELSDITAQTGIPAAMVLALLQDTSAASPQLAVQLGIEVASPAALSAQLAAAGGDDIRHAAGADILQQNMQDAAQGRMQQLAQTQSQAQTRAEALAQIAGVLQGREMAATHATASSPATQEGAARTHFAMAQSGAANSQEQIHAVLAQGGGQSGGQVAATAAALTREAAWQEAAQHKAEQRLANAGNTTPVNGGASSVAAVGKNAVQAAPTAAAAGAAQGESSLHGLLAAISNASSSQQTVAADNGAQHFLAALEQGTSLRSTGAGAVQTADAVLYSRAFATQPPVEQVAVQLRGALADGHSSIDIRLRPAELGRVEVRIETTADGRSLVTVTAERRETLDLLQRDARELERALQEAGLKTEQKDLSFNLQGDNKQQAQQDEQDAQTGRHFRIGVDDGQEIDDKLTTSENALGYDAGRGYRLTLDRGVDIRA